MLYVSEVVTQKKGVPWPYRLGVGCMGTSPHKKVMFQNLMMSLR